MKNDILITGRRGFIGSRIEGGVEFEGRIEDSWDLMYAMHGIKGIVHLAAVSDRRKCEAEPRRSIETNLIGLCNVLKIAHTSNAWVLYVSTYQVRERNLYGLTKLLGEELCRLYKEKGLNVKIIRLGVVYGPDDNKEKIVTKIINELKAGKEPNVETDNELYFSYVDDIARAIEHEVDVITGVPGELSTVTNLITGIKKCLNTGSKK